jgi:hypothetical protein
MMKQIALLIVLSTFVSDYATSQTKAWEKSLEFTASAVHIDASGAIVLSGRTSDGYGITRKFDSLGNALWTTPVGGFVGTNRAGDPVYIGQNGLLRRYDRNGTQIWEKQIESSPDNPLQQMSVDSANNVLIVTGSSTCTITKIAPDSSSLWSAPVAPGGYMRMETDRSGNSFLLYETTPPPQNFSTVNLSKLTSDGHLAWTRTWALEYEVENGGGTTRSAQHWGNISLVVTPSGFTYLGGTLTVDRSSPRSSTSKSSWLIFVIDPAGKTRKVKVAGKGSWGGSSYNNILGLYGTAQGDVFVRGWLDQRRPRFDHWEDNVATMVEAFRRNSSVFQWKRQISNVIGSPILNRFGAFNAQLDPNGGLHTYIFTRQPSINPVSIKPNGSVGSSAIDLTDWPTYAPRYYDAAGNFYMIVGNTLQRFTDINLNFNNTQRYLVPTGIAQTEFQLDNNYPNPFNPTTTIKFNLPEDALVTARVFNTLGQEVATLADRQQLNAGINELEFDGTKLTSGVYFYRIVVENFGRNKILFSSVKKMVLIK